MNDRPKPPIFSAGGTIDSSAMPPHGSEGRKLPGGTIDGRTGQEITVDSSDLPTDAAANMRAALHKMTQRSDSEDRPIIIEHGTDVLEEDEGEKE